MDLLVSMFTKLVSLVCHQENPKLVVTGEVKHGKCYIHCSSSDLCLAWWAGEEDPYGH